MYKEKIHYLFSGGGNVIKSSTESSMKLLHKRDNQWLFRLCISISAENVFKSSANLQLHYITPIFNLVKYFSILHAHVYNGLDFDLYLVDLACFRKALFNWQR